IVRVRRPPGHDRIQRGLEGHLDVPACVSRRLRRNVCAAAGAVSRERMKRWRSSQGRRDLMAPGTWDALAAEGGAGFVAGTARDHILSVILL
ncbi:MAG: hypothetical protein AB7S80_02745, partial [Rhizobiaceae bacterium]